MIGADGPGGVHCVCIAVQAKDLFLDTSNGKLASPLDVVGTGQVE